MNLLVSLMVGILFFGGTYLLLRRSIIKIILGLALLGHAANMFIFALSGLHGAQSPIIQTTKSSDYVDPVPQALILTAIVIGFGVLAFYIVLTKKAYTLHKNLDLDMWDKHDDQ